MSDATAAMLGLAVLAILAVAASTFMWTQSKRRTKWGINLQPVRCPKCGHEFPRLRVRWPVSLRQALWGGNTCPKCGQESDKWGQAV